MKKRFISLFLCTSMLTSIFATVFTFEKTVSASSGNGLRQVIITGTIRYNTKFKGGEWENNFTIVPMNNYTPYKWRTI